MVEANEIVTNKARRSVMRRACAVALSSAAFLAAVDTTVAATNAASSPWLVVPLGDPAVKALCCQRIDGSAVVFSQMLSSNVSAHVVLGRSAQGNSLNPRNQSF